MTSKRKESGRAEASRVLVHKEKPAGGGATGTPAKSTPVRAEGDGAALEGRTDATRSPTPSLEKEKGDGDGDYGDVLDDFQSEAEEDTRTGKVKERQQRQARDEALAKSGRAGPGPTLAPRLGDGDFKAPATNAAVVRVEGDWLKLVETIEASGDLALA